MLYRPVADVVAPLRAVELHLAHAFQRALLMSVAGIRDFFEQLSEKGAATFETGLPDPLRALLDALRGEDPDAAEAAIRAARALVAAAPAELSQAAASPSSVGFGIAVSSAAAARI